MANPHSDLVEIFVNTTAHQVPKGTISFGDVVKLAYGIEGEAARGYSVTYDRGPDDKPDDVLPFGGTVKVKKDMRFDVFPTGRS